MLLSELLPLPLRSHPLNVIFHTRRVIQEEAGRAILYKLAQNCEVIWNIWSVLSGDVHRKCSSLSAYLHLFTLSSNCPQSSARYSSRAWIIYAGVKADKALAHCWGKILQSKLTWSVRQNKVGSVYSVYNQLQPRAGNWDTEPSNPN